VGSLAGLLLGLAVSVVLVHVVNPQSFHWTMDLLLPWPGCWRCAPPWWLAGTLTAWLAGRAAAGQGRGAGRQGRLVSARTCHQR
jgi:putative ABC transport system permease protein